MVSSARSIYHIKMLALAHDLMCSYFIMFRKFPEWHDWWSQVRLKWNVGGFQWVGYSSECSTKVSTPVQSEWPQQAWLSHGGWSPRHLYQVKSSPICTCSHLVSPLSTRLISISVAIILLHECIVLNLYPKFQLNPRLYFWAPRKNSVISPWLFWIIFDVLNFRNLADIDNDGNLTCDEFCIAEYLIDQAIAGRQLPTSLPPTLLPSSHPVSDYFQRSCGIFKVFFLCVSIQ